MPLDNRILEDPLKLFDFLNREVYSDEHPSSPEFIKGMRQIIEEMPDKTMQYIVLAGYLTMLEGDTYIIADLSRMKIVCDVEDYLKKNKLNHPKPRARHR